MRGNSRPSVASLLSQSPVRVGRSIALLSAMVVGLAACGADTSTPTGGMTASYETAKSGTLQQQIAFVACVSGSGIGSEPGFLLNITEQGLAATGITTDDISDAFRMSFDGFEVSETSQSGDQATVEVTFTATLDVDSGKVRELVRRMSEAQDMAVDDATLDAEMDRRFGEFPVTQDLTHSVNVVQTDGRWHACDDAAAAAPLGVSF